MRYQLWLIGCLLLVACIKRDAVPLSETIAPVGSPAVRSLEPTMPEAVSRAFQRSCQSCHGPAGHGILAIAPDLRRANSRSPGQWKQFLSDPETGHPGAQLSPPTWLNTAESALLADYLANLTALNPPLPAPTKPVESRRQRGERAR